MRLMRMMKDVTACLKRFVFLMLAVVLMLPAGGEAGGKPAVSGLNQPAAMQMAVQVLSLPDTDEKTLEGLNSLLSPAKLLLYQDPSRGLAGLRLTRGEEALAAMESREGAHGTELILSLPGQMEAARLISGPEGTPWTSLWDLPSRFVDAALAAQAWEGGKAVFDALMANAGEPAKRAVNLRSAGRGVTQQSRVLPQEEADAFLQRLWPELVLLMKALPGMSGLEGNASGIQVPGKLTVRRLFDKQGAVIGVQAAGGLMWGESARTLNLTLALSEAGFYLTFKAPAKRGSDTLEFHADLSFSKGLSGDFSARHRQGARDVRLNGEAKLVLAAVSQGQTLTGSLAARLRIRDGNNRTLLFSLMPELLLAKESLSGSLRYEGGRDGRTPLAMEVDLIGVGQKVPDALVPQVEIRLDAATSTDLALYRERINLAVKEGIRTLLLTLPEDTRRHVLHDLGRDQRALMKDNPEISPPSGEEDAGFTVDEPGDSPSEEETP